MARTVPAAPVAQAPGISTPLPIPLVAAPVAVVAPAPVAAPVAVPATVVPVPAVSTAVDGAELNATMLAVVAEKTGYPSDMLELSMDMEADLGIDSIKRVEILGAVQEEYPDLPELDPEIMGELRTLGDIVDYMNGQIATASS